MILAAAKPEVVYTHNLADKHDTHVAVVVPLIRALREIPASERPAEVYGVEVWRDLNWLLDDEKVLLNMANRPNLVRALISIFDSQISGGQTVRSRAGRSAPLQRDVLRFARR